MTDDPCGAVDPANLAITSRVSRERAAYQQYTRSVAALDRVADSGLERHPGVDVRYVVVDDSRDDHGWARLASESPTGYDTAFYRVGPCAPRRACPRPLASRRIDEYLRDGERTRLGAF